MYSQQKFHLIKQGKDTKTRLYLKRKVLEKRKGGFFAYFFCILLTAAKDVLYNKRK